MDLLEDLVLPRNPSLLLFDGEVELPLQLRRNSFLLRQLLFPGLVLLLESTETSVIIMVIDHFRQKETSIDRGKRQPSFMNSTVDKWSFHLWMFSGHLHIFLVLL